MTTKKAAKTREQILEFIREEIKAQGYPPTVREIKDAVGLKSTSTVHGHLDRLERDGYIRRLAGSPRAIVVMERKEITDDAE